MDMTGVAGEVFDVLLSYKYTVKLFDETGADIAEPEEARRMFAQSPNLLLSLKDLDDDSCIELAYGKSTHANDIEGLMQALRTVATKYNMSFVPHQYGEDIDPKDFRNLEAVSESLRKRIMRLCEGMYGTSRTSYLQLENAKLIVHHHDRLNLRRPDARATQIAEMFVEAQGQRLRLPSCDLKIARMVMDTVNAGSVLSEAVKLAEPVRQPKINPHVLAENYSVVRGFLNWTERFAPDRALVEFHDPDAFADTDLPDDFNSEIDDDPLLDFDPQEFIMSEELKHVLPSGEEGDDEVSRRDVMEALVHYLERCFDPQHPDFGLAGEEDKSEWQDMAEQVWDQVDDALHEAGYVVHDDMTEDNTEELHEPNMMEPEGDDQLMLADDCIISREDILLPNANQGEGLAHEVGKATVNADPDHPDAESEPEMSYIRRLQTLSGMRSGRPY